MHVVHVPGMGLDGRSSEALRRALSRAGHPSSVALLPGMGRRVPGRLTVPGLAEALLAQLPAEPVVLLGHSLSCQVVVAAAVARPTAVAGLVLVGPTTDPTSRPLPVLAARWLRTARHEPAWQIPLLVRQYARTGLPSMAEGLRAGLADPVEARLPAYPGPVVVVRGTYDRICPGPWAARLAATSPGGSYAEVVGAAHMAVLTHPQAVSEVVADVAAVVCRTSP